MRTNDTCIFKFNHPQPDIVRKKICALQQSKSFNSIITENIRFAFKAIVYQNVFSGQKS